MRPLDQLRADLKGLADSLNEWMVPQDREFHGWTTMRLSSVGDGAASNSGFRPVVGSQGVRCLFNAADGPT